MEIEKRAFRISVIVGLLKGILYGLIPFPIWQDKPLPVILGIFTFTIIASIAGEYFLFYSPNMKAHSKLLQTQKAGYQQKYEVALKELGLRRMLQKHWFALELKNTKK